MLQETSSEKGSVEAPATPGHDHIVGFQTLEKSDQQTPLLIGPFRLEVLALTSLRQETRTNHNSSIGLQGRSLDVKNYNSLTHENPHFGPSLKRFFQAY